MELHDQPVRASPRISARFTLLMASSLGFGSYTTPLCLQADFRPIKTRFRYASGEDPLNKGVV